MPSPDTDNPASELSNLDLGSIEYIDQLNHRIERHYSSPIDDKSLIVGIFGEWGCGKTHWLKQVEKHFQADFEKALEPLNNKADLKKAELVLPVFFNAWRHEKEEHLIIPLLKCVEQKLKQHLEPIITKRGTLKKTKDAVFKTLDAAKDSCLALAAGLQGKLTAPFFGELKYSVKDVLAHDKQSLQDRQKNEDKEREVELDQISLSRKYQSIYYDFESSLKRLTCGQESGDIKIKLLFLIDDLDRCIPENAIDILESIKLFLDIEGCSFVLAVDEEIVEKGVMHRYKEYLFENVKADSNGDSEIHLQAPITGHEYLEKLIQLPIRIPRPRRTNVRAFLAARFSGLFAVKTTAGDTEQDKANPDHLKSRRQDKPESKNELLDLFSTHTPPVPRKLIRAASLFEYLLEVIKRKGIQDIDQLFLARLVLLQLFAPEIYRFVRRKNYFAALREWSEMPISQIQLELNSLQKSGNKNDLVVYQDHKLPLFRMVKEAKSFRSGFDPCILFKSDEPFSLDFELHCSLIEQTKAPARSRKQGGHLDYLNKPTVTPQDTLSFSTYLASNDSSSWESVLQSERENLANGYLGNEVWEPLLSEVSQQTNFENWKWVTTLEPYLSPNQLMQAYRELGILDKWKIPAATNEQ